MVSEKTWRILKRMARIIGVLLVVALLGVLFVWGNGIQYSLALLTGSLRDPYFDSEQYAPEQNCFSETPCTSGTVRILSYNVLCRICEKEGYDPWDERIGHLRELVKRYDPDLIGSQELGSWKDIAEFLPEGDLYDAVTFEFGPWTYADAALFYRKSRYDVVTSGQFWLSPKPHLPFGFAWIPLSAPRYVSWAHLRDKHNGFEFLFMNSHVDNNSLNKDTSAPLIFETFSPHAKTMPIVFTGDFNTNPQADRYRLFQQGHGDVVVFVNAADLAPTLEQTAYAPDTVGPIGTLPYEHWERTIDHIFLAGPVEMDVRQWQADFNTYGPEQRPASDHPAIFAEAHLTLSSDAGDSSS